MTFEETLKQAVREAIEPLQQEIRELKAEASGSTIPYVMTRKQFMEIFDVSETKFAELAKRADFPVNRELGGPRILRDDALKFFRDHYKGEQLYGSGYHLKGIG